MTYGDDISINGAVTTSSGGSVIYGSVALQVYSTKTPVWTTVQTDDTAGSYYFFDVLPESNSQYKVVYSGFTATNGDVYTPSESAPVTVQVERKFARSWRKYKVIKTDARGKWRIKLPAPTRRKTFWRFSVASDVHFVGWSAKGWTRRY